MARLALVAAAAASALAQCPPNTLPVGQSIQKLGTRDYHLYVPKSYTAAGPVPIVVYAHGFTDKCADFPTQFLPQSESRQFIFVSLCGDLGDISFNAGTCCPPANTLEIPDVQFARDVVGNLSKQLCLDPARIFSTGFSNGAMLSQRIACEASDLFVASASCSGVVELQPGNDEGLAECDASYAKSGRKMNVLDIHGLEDVVVPMGGDAILGFPNITINMARWATRNSCPSPPTQTLKNGSFSNQVWKGCGADGSATIEIVHNANGAHAWPEQAGWSSTAYILDWFDRVTKK